MRRNFQGFTLRNADLRRDILVPRYYDPRIEEDLSALKPEFELVSIAELVTDDFLLHDHGSYVPKIHYGSGPYPYLRTSDLANWEIKASPKHGVSQEVYDQYQKKQDLRPEDILFVHEGTYLIGSAAMLTVFDGPALFQHHLARFRVKAKAPFGAYYFLAALESGIVQRQIRSKQFSADIIDSVVGRIGEILIPLPKDAKYAEVIDARVRSAVLGRAEAKEQLAHFVRSLDLWLQTDRASIAPLLEWRPSPSEYRGRPAFLGSRPGFVSFTIPSRDIRGAILLPKYYDPIVEEAASAYSPRCTLRTIRELVDEGVVSLSTGDEIGKINYGSGPIPFVRTSDLASWELKRNPKQGVAQDVFESYAARQGVRAGDVLLVRDGTYLVGSSVLLFDDDLPQVYCGGLIKFRAQRPTELSPELLFALLNLPFVRRQMRNKQFTRDVIDTLGKRILEVVLPIPEDSGTREAITLGMRELLSRRNTLRRELDQTVREVFVAPAR